MSSFSAYSAEITFNFDYVHREQLHLLDLMILYPER